MKIYQIEDAMMRLVDPETGELKDYEAFAALNMERNRKIEGMAIWYKNLAAEAKAIREEEVALAERRKVLENRANRLKDYIARVTGGERFTTSKVAVSFRSSQSLNVFNEEAAVKWLEENSFDELVTYNAPTVKKDEVKKILKTVENIPGCVLEDNRSTIIK